VPMDNEPQDGPLSRFGFDAIDIRRTLRDIIAKRWTSTSINPDHLTTLMELSLVEMRDDKPFATIRGQGLATN
jgi:hypothetical protein